MQKPLETYPSDDAPAVPATPVPQHVAIIMDGNRRWAAKRGRPALFGHRAGAEAARRAVDAAIDLGVRWLTLYAFSSENWRRPQDEVGGLMRLLHQGLERHMDEMIDRGVRLRMIAEVPLGAFLSGGVDSSAVVAMMAGQSAGPVNTCSISFASSD